MKLPAQAQKFWDEYRATLADDVSVRFHEVFHFADSERVADELAQLVLAGTKRATASLAWMHEHEGTTPPSLGPGPPRSTEGGWPRGTGTGGRGECYPRGSTVPFTSPAGVPRRTCPSPSSTERPSFAAASG